MSKDIERLDVMMPHGRISKDILHEFWNLYIEDEDPDVAYKFLAAAVEYSLCGDTNFQNDKEIMRILRRYTEVLDHNLDSYNATCDNNKFNRHYEEIAQLYWKDKITQAKIGERFGITQQEVSRRLKFIQANYPDLFSKYYKG